MWIDGKLVQWAVIVHALLCFCDSTCVMQAAKLQALQESEVMKDL